MRSLKRYRVTLTAVGPVHVGSGQSYSQKEFIAGQHYVEVPDPVRLTQWVTEKGKLDQFERFVLRRDTRTGAQQSLGEWLRAERIEFDEGQCGGYVLDLPDIEAVKQVIGRDGRPTGGGRPPLNELRGFIKDPYGCPYLPGSSLKGVLRSLVLKSRMAGTRPEGHRASDIERQYLRTLNLGGEGGGQAVYDVMRGIHVSDSEPLTLNDLTVCQKIDAIPPRDDRDRYWGLPTYRECLKPGTRVRFTVTVDTGLLEGELFGVKVRESVRREPLAHVFDPFKPGPFPTWSEILADLVYREYFRSYLDKYKLPEPPIGVPTADVEPKYPFVYVGAGSGFYTKTIWDELEPDHAQRHLSVQKSLSDTRAFRIHKHENDIRNHGVSPRAIKLTRHRGRFYEMGKCRLAVEPLEEVES
jgi:CRISPR-associated protein Csm5